jgi:hypothetical protein
LHCRSQRNTLAQRFINVAKNDFGVVDLEHDALPELRIVNNLIASTRL